MHQTVREKTVIKHHLFKQLHREYYTSEAIICTQTDYGRFNHSIDMAAGAKTSYLNAGFVYITIILVLSAMMTLLAIFLQSFDGNRPMHVTYEAFTRE